MEETPSQPVARLLPRAIWTLAASIALATGIFLLLNARVVRAGAIGSYVLVVGVVLSYVTVGGLIAGRLPRNPIGWILCVAGTSIVTAAFSEQYGVYGLVTSPGSLPAAKVVGSFGNWVIVPAIAPLILVLLLFPDGKPLSPRWRIAVWAAAAVTVVGTLGNALVRLPVTGLTNLLGDANAGYPNPTGIFPNKGAMSVVLGITGVTGVVTAVASLVSLFFRRRRADREQRQQLAWLAYVGGAAVILFLAAVVVGSVLGESCAAPCDVLFGLLFTVILLGVPVACGIAILKYRLYDLEVVVKKSVVLGALIVSFTIVYLAVVVGIGAAVGDRGNSALTFLAAAMVAIAFQPIRTRARRFADRLVYGKRATPYEILSEFSERVAGTYSTEDVLPRMARILVEGTGGIRADIWLRVGDQLRPEAVWPTGETERGPVSLRDGGLDALGSAEARAFPVEHQGELLGAITVTPSAAEPLTPSGQKLIRDLAAQAGLVLRNVRLIEELRASRQRIVAAQDEERRRIERNIHDGAQQQLVALNVKLGLVHTLARKDLDKAEQLIEELRGETQAALEDLRDLARGIYPPLLADQGLAAALASQARKAPLPIRLDPAGIGRYPQEAEAAIYFCVLEALQNVAKYAGASQAQISLAAANGQLTFQVADDGAGFDPAGTSMGTGLQGMADRLAALGGSLQIASVPGAGTTVSGFVPIGHE
jgi:signal transduction histidine kinase